MLWNASRLPPTPRLTYWLLLCSAGITNWLAVKMLFDRICNLPGSGVIPMRFKEIREVGLVS